MIIKIPKIAENSRILMQKLGYNEHRHKETMEQNYTRRLSPERYPRLHAYLEEKPGGLLIKLHLDMQESKAFGRKHGGVYEHELLVQEGERIRKFVSLQAGQEKVEDKGEKKGFWGRLFG